MKYLMFTASLLLAFPQAIKPVILDALKLDLPFAMSTALLEEYYIEFLREMCDKYETLPPMNDIHITNAFLEWLAVHVRRYDLLDKRRYCNTQRYVQDDYDEYEPVNRFKKEPSGARRCRRTH
jgi:hypothetical protein